MKSGNYDQFSANQGNSAPSKKIVREESLEDDPEVKGEDGKWPLMSSFVNGVKKETLGEDDETHNQLVLQACNAAKRWFNVRR